MASKGGVNRVPGDYSDELVLHNAMMFAFLDMVESEIVDIEQIAKREGRCMSFEVRRSWNAIRHHVKLLRGLTRTCPEDEQEAIGNSSDLYRLFIWRLVSLCSADKTRYFLIYNAMKSMYKSSDLIDLSRDEKSVFDTLLDND